MSVRAKKQVVVGFIVLIAMIVFIGCAGDTTSSDAKEASENGLQLTLEELSEYDGKNGNPAYVAVDGIIYDVSNSNRWPSGAHRGCDQGFAGRDLTEVIKGASPHGLRVLNNVPIVGKIIE